MELDRDRLRAILEADHSYYGSHAPDSRDDDRLVPRATEFIASQFSPDMRVLDVGCGSGATLLENAHRFATGLGIDDDPAHVRLAEEALRRSGRDNVEFRLLDFRENGRELEPESFDFVFSERGPIGYDGYGIQTALRVVKEDGLLFSEVIGNLHHQEVNAIFGPSRPRHQMIRTLDEVRVAMERNGVSIRIASETVTKRYYPSIYDWLQFQGGIWAWGGGALPSPDDPRLSLFAERYTRPSGEIETTHHVVWVGGVKRTAESFYAERSYFGSP